MLRCLGMPPPRPTNIVARANAARAALRSYQPKPHAGKTSGGGARESGAVERAFWTGLAALSSQGCMRGAPVRWGNHGPCVEDARHDCVIRSVSNAVVLKGGNRAVWPVGAQLSTDVRACHLRPQLSPYPHKPRPTPFTPFHPPPSPLPPPINTIPTLPTISIIPTLYCHLTPPPRRGTQVDILVSNTTDAIACLATRFKHTRVTGLPPAQLHFDVMTSPSPLRR